MFDLKFEVFNKERKRAFLFLQLFKLTMKRVSYSLKNFNTRYFKGALFVSLLFKNVLLAVVSLEDVKKNIVSLENNIQKSAYINNLKIQGTAFFIDRERGILVTNSHLVNNTSVNDVHVTLYNGLELKAKYLYSDPWHDFSFISVEPKSLEKNVKGLKLNTNFPTNGDEVLIIGNNDGIDFSFQKGKVIHRYKSMGLFPNQSLAISLNTKGGSSGSPVLNNKHDVIGLNFSRYDTTSFTLPIGYVLDAFNELLNKKVPQRKELGALYKYYSLNHAVKYLNFPKNKIEPYIKKYPHALCQAIKIERVFKDSPAYDLLEAGDILWRVNNEDVGPNIYKMQKLFNRENKITLDVYRNGQLRKIKIKPYNLQTQRINRMILFGGAVFYRADDFIRLMTGARIGSVFISNPGEGLLSELPGKYYEGYGYFTFLEVKKLAQKKITSLDDVKKIIPSLVKKKTFPFYFKNYSFITAFSAIPIMNRLIQQEDITYRSFGIVPTDLNFDKKTQSWQATRIEK